MSGDGCDRARKVALDWSLHECPTKIGERTSVRHDAEVERIAPDAFTPGGYYVAAWIWVSDDEVRDAS